MQTKLASIAPTWVKAFKTWGRLNANEKEAIKNQLHIENLCVVGEAWGWKIDYLDTCEECKYYSWAFMFVLNGPNNVLDRDLFAQKGKEFSKHYFRDHKCAILIKNEKKRKNSVKR